MNKLLKFLFSFILVLAFGVSTAQLNQNQQTNAPALGNGVGVGEQFITSAPYRRKLLGNPYLEEEWMKAKVKIKGGTEIFSLEKLKYDVANNLFELVVDDKVVNISGTNVDTFELIDELGSSRRFIRCDGYEFDDKQLSGYFEVLYDGDIMLFQRSYAYIKRATYNQALMIGEKDDSILIKEEYYYSSVVTEVVLIKKSKDLKSISKIEFKERVSINRFSLIDFFMANKF